LLILFKWHRWHHQKLYTSWLMCSVMQLMQLNWTPPIHFHAYYALSQTSNYVKRPGCIASELHFSSLQVLLTHFWPPNPNMIYSICSDVCSFYRFYRHPSILYAVNIIQNSISLAVLVCTQKPSLAWQLCSCQHHKRIWFDVFPFTS
jgi:hypothetical protein